MTALWALQSRFSSNTQSSVSGIELNQERAHMEALSWRILTETARKSPERLRIYELHFGGGQYDALSLLTSRPQAVMSHN